MSECTTVPTAYFDQINAQGGINGHPIKVVTCYTTASATNMSYCLQSLLANSKVVAIVGGGSDTGLLRFDTGSNGVAVLAPGVDVTDDLTSPFAFDVSNFSEVGGSLGALARYGLAQGYTNPVLLECEYQACSDVQTALTNIYAGTSSHLKAIVAPIAAPNYTTYLAAAQHAHSGLVMIAETAQDDATMVQSALNLDYHPVFGWTYSCYDEPAIAAVKGVSATILCPQPFKAWTAVGGQLEATMQKYGPSKWNWNYVTVLSWIGAHMFVDAAKTVNGPVTRQSFETAMNHVTNFTNEFLPEPIDFSKPGPSALAPRVPDYLWYIYKVTGGQLVPVTPTAIQVPPIS
jgi:branched-chain amino acid transport system substrate-binding protein